MLKRKEFIYESQQFKIKNPTKEDQIQIHEEIVKIMKKNKITTEQALDNVKLNKYLLSKLVVSDDADFKFERYSLSNFSELLNQDIQELNEIMYQVGTIVSDIILNQLKENLLQAKIAEMRLLQAEAFTSLENLTSLTNEIEKSKKLNEKLVNELKVKNNG